MDWCFSLLYFFQKYTMNFDKSTGIIEMFMDSLEVTDEGTFTFNLVDGKAKGTTSLVLIGDGKTSNAIFTFILMPCIQICQNINVKCEYRIDTPTCSLILMAHTKSHTLLGVLHLLQLKYMSIEGQQKTTFSLLSCLLLVAADFLMHFKVMKKMLLQGFRIWYITFTFAVVQNSGSFKRNQNLRGQNGSGNKVRALTYLT